jgi:hypothetical protein
LGLYEPFLSSKTLGEFFLDSGLPCATICTDANSSCHEDGDTSQLEKVRELVGAAAASLNAALEAPCGPVSVLYCLANMHQRGCLSPEHLSDILIPAMASLMRLSSLNFVDLSRQGCSMAISLIDRMSAVESACAIIVVDANINLANVAAVENSESTHSEDDVRRFGELHALINCCIEAKARACNVKILIVLPQSVPSAPFLKKIPSIANASADDFVLCHIPLNSLNCWEITDDNAVAASVPVMFALLRLLRSIHFDTRHIQRTHSCWWELWDAEVAVINSVKPPVLTAVSMLRSRSMNSSPPTVSHSASPSRLPTRSLMLSRGSTPSIAAKLNMNLANVHALESAFPSIICTFSDDVNEEEVITWFKIGGAEFMMQLGSQSDDLSTGQSSETSTPILITAEHFGNSDTVAVTTDLCHELIKSLSEQLPYQYQSEWGAHGTTELDDLQTKFSQLVMCEQCKKRGLIMILPSRTPAMLDCFHWSLRPIPSHVIIILLAPVRMVHQVQSWLHPTIQTHINDVGAAQVNVDTASDAALRMPPCVNGHAKVFPSTNSPAECALDTPNISWTQIYDTRCAIMMHKEFATCSGERVSAKQCQSPSSGSLPYSSQGSPQLGSFLNERSSLNLDELSPSSAIRSIHLSSSIKQPFCCQALSIACEIFSSRSVFAIIGSVLALPGIPLHLLSRTAVAILKQSDRDLEAHASNYIPTHRDLTSTAFCLAPFFFHTQASQTDFSFSSKFPRLQENFEVQFGISRTKWKEMQQAASLSLMIIADPASDGTFVGLAEEGSWLCENLLLLLLKSNCHDMACEVASNVLKWYAVQKRIGSNAMHVLVKRCCGIIEYLALQEGPEPFKLRIFRNTLNDLRTILEVLNMIVREQGHVRILEGLVLRIWLGEKPAMSMVNLTSSALHRIASLQDRVLQIFQNSASILKSSAPGCVWRLLRRANAAEWLSHVRWLITVTLSHGICFLYTVSDLVLVEAAAGGSCQRSF